MKNIKTGDPGKANDDDSNQLFIGETPSIMVIEEDDDTEVAETGLFDHAGDPLVRMLPSSKQGFIGFLRPSWLRDEDKDDA